MGGAPVPICTDVPAGELRRLARQESYGRVTCRLTALANVLDGMTREQAARHAGMDRQTLTDWVIRSNPTRVEDLHDRPREAARCGSMRASWWRCRA
jgi:hypothetical protein